MLITLHKMSISVCKSIRNLTVFVNDTVASVLWKHASVRLDLSYYASTNVLYRAGGRKCWDSWQYVFWSFRGKGLDHTEEQYVSSNISHECREGGEGSAADHLQCDWWTGTQWPHTQLDLVQLLHNFLWYGQNWELKNSDHFFVYCIGANCNRQSHKLK